MHTDGNRPSNGDDGKVVVRIFHQQGRIIVAFEQPISRLGIDPAACEEFIRLLQGQLRILAMGTENE